MALLPEPQIAIAMEQFQGVNSVCYELRC